MTEHISNFKNQQQRLWTKNSFICLDRLRAWVRGGEGHVERVHGRSYWAAGVGGLGGGGGGDGRSLDLGGGSGHIDRYLGQLKQCNVLFCLILLVLKHCKWCKIIMSSQTKHRLEAPNY